jgi:SAM-dependent methyltransferase
MTENSSLAVNIDFDPVAEFYDYCVITTFDLGFWIEVARRSSSPRLELMCGTGRLTIPILQAGLLVEGLDYSRGLVEICRGKAFKFGLDLKLHLGDARDFDLAKKYELVFIGFHAISEVLTNEDKERVFRCVRRHLSDNGHFWISCHNPIVRRTTLDGKERVMGIFPVDYGDEELHFSGQFFLDTGTNIATGIQKYVIKRNGIGIEKRELSVRFHLISPDELTGVLERVGWIVDEQYGDYDFSPYNAEASPFFIVRCHPG